MVGDFESIVWIPGVENLADTLKKPPSGVSSPIIDELLEDSRLVQGLDSIRRIFVAKIEEL